MIFGRLKKASVLFKVVLTVNLLSLISATLLFVFYMIYVNDLTEDTKREAFAETQKGAAKLDQHFRDLMAKATEMADLLSAGHLNKDNITDSIERVLANTPYMYGMGVAYIPYTNDPNIRNKSPYYVARGKVHLQRESIVEIYSEPIYKVDSATNTVINTGRVFADYQLVDIKDIMNNMEMGRSGYGFLLKRDGSFISHPVAEYNVGNKTMFDVASEREDGPLRVLAERTVKGYQGVIEHSDELTGQLSWMFYEPIPSLGWSVVTVFIKDDIPFDERYMRTQLVFISISLVVFLISLFAMLVRAYTMDTLRLWIFVSIASFVLLGELLFIWHLTLNITSTDEYANAVKIVDRTGADNFKNNYNQRVKRLCDVEPIYIPTGIFIETIEFPTPNNVFLSGTVWQKYTVGTHDSIARGVVFPESIADVFTEAYHYRQGNEEVIGWYFRVTIRKNFSYQKYPFDRKNLTIRLLPQDFKHYIVLSPELDSYKYTNPMMLPGLSSELKVSGWAMVYSNFLYVVKKYNTDFGINGFNCRENTPELFFDISMARSFIGTIFSGSMPVLVMLAILFILQTITTQTIDTVSRILGPTGSFFFAALLAHVGLRSSLNVSDIVYFEYFYILLYMMILYVFLNSVLYSRPGMKMPLLTYKDNLAFKLLYWPTFLITLIIISIVVLLF